MDISRQIKQARIRKGYNQEYVAQMLGVSRQAVSKWETGLTQPDTKNLIALAELLDVSVDQLLDRPRKDTPVASSQKVRFLCKVSILLLLIGLSFGGIGFFYRRIFHHVIFKRIGFHERRYTFNLVRKIHGSNAFQGR